MSAFTHWLAMGGYAAFVWPAYAIAVAVLGGMTVQSWWRHRRSTAELDDLQRSGGDRE